MVPFSALTAPFQIMHLVLFGVKRGMVTPGLERVSVPHGAESGFDPYQAYHDLTDDSMLGYIHGKMLPRGAAGEWVRRRVVACDVPVDACD